MNLYHEALPSLSATKNPSEVRDITSFYGFTPPAPADCRGSEDPHKVQEISAYGPAQASASSAAVTNQLIAGGDCASAEQSIGSVRLSPSVPVSCETTADEDIIARAAFGASPISPLPEGVFEILRTIRVILGEAKCGSQ